MIPDAPLQGCTLEATIADVPNPDPTAGNTAVLATTDGQTPPGQIDLWNFVVPGTGANPDLFQFVLPARPLTPADIGTPLALVDACTNAVDYCMVGLGDIDPNTGMETQFFYPNTGEATINVTGTGDVGDTFSVSMTASRFDHYDAPGGAMSTDGCNGTVSAFAAVDITIAAPAFAPQDGVQYKKWGKYQRPERQ